MVLFCVSASASGVNGVGVGGGVLSQFSWCFVQLLVVLLFGVLCQ